MTVTGDRLDEAMRRRGYDQSRLARELGVSQGTISKILLGKTANSRLMPKIAVKLGVPLPWLLGDAGASENDDEDALTPEERELLDLQRQLATKDRQAVLQLMRSLAEAHEEKPTVHAPKPAYRAASNG